MNGSLVRVKFERVSVYEFEVKETTCVACNVR